ncbi:MAG TPA: hypothetical protein VFP98_10625, partial [Candidatus Polarisedimenticolia bacterium]|nr:hypothetical protein [Candidatus Polarisedimenticolia bacterium]
WPGRLILSTGPGTIGRTDDARAMISSCRNGWNSGMVLRNETMRPGAAPNSGSASAATSMVPA